MIGVGTQYLLHFKVLFYAQKVFLQLYAHIFNVTSVFFYSRVLRPNSEQKWVLYLHGSISNYLNLIVAAEDSQSTFSAL